MIITILGPLDVGLGFLQNAGVAGRQELGSTFLSHVSQIAAES